MQPDTPLMQYARLTGLLYLIIIICGIFAEGFVRSSLIVPGDAAATAANIVADTVLFRIGFVADTVMLLCDVAVAVLLYILLRPVSRNLSLAAAGFRLMQAAVLGFNLLNYYAALLLLRSQPYVDGFDTETRNTAALLFLDLHSHGYDLGLIFFGVSNIILGYLIVKAAYLPSWLGYGLYAAAGVYLAGSMTRFLVPGFTDTFAPFYIVPLVAELALCLWLLIKG